MIRFLSHILRFMLIAFGFLMAVVAASVFVLVLFWAGAMRGDPETHRLITMAIGLSLPVTVAFAGYYSFIPGIVFAVIAEIAGRRSWLFHAIGGMVVAIVALAIRAADNQLPGMFLLTAAAGAVGGTVYWLIAGRSAGRHLDDADPTSVSSGS